MLTHEQAVSAIREGKTALGLELGSTRIKAILIGPDFAPLASGSHNWENRLEDGVWTYRLEDVWEGVQDSYRRLKEAVKAQYGETLRTASALGFSAMMHGYLPFDREGNQLAPFRTWRNTITEEAAGQLTALFQFNIPQRWSIAHLWQAVLNGEEHVKEIAYLTTLAGYVHWSLTGEKVLGVGEASDGEIRPAGGGKGLPLEAAGDPPEGAARRGGRRHADGGRGEAPRPRRGFTARDPRRPA